MRGTDGAAAGSGIRSGQLPPFDEGWLLEQARDGDPDAFEQLVDAHLGGIFRLSLLMLNRRGRAEDVVRDTFVAAWRNVLYLETPGQLRTWLFRYCISCCVDAGPHRRRGKALPGGSPAETEELAALLQRIAPVERACWLLHELHGLPDGQIAEILAQGDTAVSQNIAHAWAELTRQWPRAGPKRSRAERRAERSVHAGVHKQRRTAAGHRQT